PTPGRWRARSRPRHRSRHHRAGTPPMSIRAHEADPRTPPHRSRRSQQQRPHFAGNRTNLSLRVDRRPSHQPKMNAPSPMVHEDLGMHPVIQLTNVTKCYGHQSALDHVTLTVPPGVVFALLGENGAGKTTAIRLMLGLTEPTIGTVRVLGLDSGREGF